MIATQKDNGEELFPIVDEAGHVIGSASRAVCHGGSHLLHPVVHLHVFNSQGDLYLQRRPLWKDIQPGKWDTAVGGHIDFGEGIEEALRREASEELGIEDFVPEPLPSYVFESDRERELVYPFRTIFEGPIYPSAETAGGRFWSAQELAEVISSPSPQLTPNFMSEYQRLFL
ncbi:MAG: NUDIX domain-containing protein [Bacteroidaceae bacterium]|nr:NUDIX domain-containing protein [Bacteroidaceae bacterium]